MHPYWIAVQLRLVQEENGRLPRSYDMEDAASMVQLANKINEQANNRVDLDEVCGTCGSKHACISAPLCCCKLFSFIRCVKQHNSL